MLQALKLSPAAIGRADTSIKSDKVRGGPMEEFEIRIDTHTLTFRATRVGPVLSKWQAVRHVVQFWQCSCAIVLP